MKEVIKVLHLESGEERLINLNRFNPELHQKIGEPFLMGEDGVIELKELPEEPKYEKSIDPEVEKVENESENDLLNVSKDKVSELGWGQLKSLAKSLGLPSRGVKRELLQAQVIDKLSNK